MARLVRMLRSAIPWRDREDRFATLPLTGRRHNNNEDNEDNGDDEDDDDEDLKDVEQFSYATTSTKSRRLRCCSSPNLRRYLSYLLPFFIAAPLGLTDRKLPATHATTYLNGVRGLACWVVLNHHLAMKPYEAWIFRPYGAQEPDAASNLHFFQLPWIRALHTGKGMVCVFFALSGYVLAYSPARKMNAKGLRPASYGDEMLTSLASSTLRRAIRLFGPMLVVVFFIALETYYCWWAHNFQREADTLLGHLYAVWLIIVPVLNPYRWDYKLPDPAGQTWTLGFEYRLSLLLFLVNMSVSRVSAVARKLIISSVMVWGFYADRRWDVFAFLGGALVAESRFAPLADDVASVLGTQRLRPHRYVVQLLAMCSVALGLLLCSVPEANPEQGWPYRVFWSWTLPESWVGHHEEPSAAWIWWYGGFGSVMLLWGLEQLAWLQAVLALAPFAYLGEISYAFYLLQIVAWQAVAWPLMLHAQDQWGWSITGRGFVLYYISANLSCLLMADYFWRAVDLQFVVLARVVVVDWLGVGRKEKAPAEAVPYMSVPVAESDAFALQSQGQSQRDSDDDTLPVSARESSDRKPGRL